ncbi:MAG: hypothetical protein ACK5WO_08985 [Cyclobacteriaceae bacterium]|jgi:hypothetical protein|nr:hypothetical protein [Flammeovirgaceae bacterium]
MKTLSVLVLVLFALSAQAQFKNRPLTKSNFEEIDFEGLVRLFLGKDARPLNSVEGIYLVSCTVTRQGGFLANPHREKVVRKKENYGKVAILKYYTNSKREFIEVSLTGKPSVNYPITGEFNVLSDDFGFIYKHFRPRESDWVFTFANPDQDLFEGIATETRGKRTIRTKLTYLRIYPSSAAEEKPVVKR